MSIEQLPPNKPNFKLILTLFCVALLVIFAVAYFTLDWDGSHLVPHRSHPKVTSQLILPGVHGQQQPDSIAS